MYIHICGGPRAVYVVSGPVVLRSYRGRRVRGREEKPAKAGEEP